jgi:hypothetical protein
MTFFDQFSAAKGLFGDADKLNWLTELTTIIHLGLSDLTFPTGC